MKFWLHNNILYSNQLGSQFNIYIFLLYDSSQIKYDSLIACAEHSARYYKGYKIVRSLKP